VKCATSATGLLLGLTVTKGKVKSGQDDSPLLGGKLLTQKQKERVTLAKPASANILTSDHY
jgi:hypothetical protein